MSFGLEVYKNNGDVMLTVTDRITRLHSVITTALYFNGYSQAFIIPGASNDGTWFMINSRVMSNLACTHVFSTDLLTVTTRTLGSGSFIGKYPTEFFVMRY